ncbi:amidase [Nocardioides massiliensis]|uniref:Amidase n=1 Tax=Nocardioides massiliensis TaxID=1325935 RepID=A0ABT9NNH4_9ACTN|nr:amidase [Nocardioides massiliensis]MDP9821968.1 amidase [Nocardioides massiliensis]
MSTQPGPGSLPRTIHAFTDDALGDDDAVGLVARLATREVAPIELVEAAIARAERVQPVLNGLAYADFNRARAEARGVVSSLAGTLLHGIPTLVKDNVDVAGWPTQHGTGAFTSRPAAAHGDFTEQLLGTGLVPLGKSRLSEFGFSASAEYPSGDPVRNPWSTSHSSGASSAGSAAFVAAGVVPIAHANDGGGSIRIPAAVCGLVGLKPTRGRLRADKLTRSMPVGIVHEGVVTRSVRDTAAFLAAAEREYRNLHLSPLGHVEGPVRRRLRVGLVVNSPFRTTDETTERVVREAAAMLADLGHDVREVIPPVPAYFEEDFVLYWGSLALAMTAGGKRMLDASFDTALTDNLTRGLARASRRRLHRLPLAIARLRASTRVAARFYEREHLDVVLSPVLAHTTPRLGHLSPTEDYETIIARLTDWVSFTPLQNATGEPALSLPFGQDSEGLPVGIQLAGPKGADRTLLELAYAVEEARPFRRITA